MKNSIKQLLRTPYKTVLLILLILLSTVLLVIGIYLGVKSFTTLKKIDEEYVTIATFQQKETSVELYSQWNNSTTSYTNVSYPEYNRVLSHDVFNIEEADYIYPPEKRTYFGAVSENLVTSSSRKMSEVFLIVEFTPQEDCIPNQPVSVDIVNVLMGEIYSSTSFWFCDHYTKDPQPLEYGKNYIAGVMFLGSMHGDSMSSVLEAVPMSTPYSTQYNEKGEYIETEFSTEKIMWEEVTADFYETGRGRYWLNLVDSYSVLDSTIPVLATGHINLLPSFHSSNATIVEGVRISDSNFLDGDKVCMVTQDFANINNLNLGDSIDLDFYFANENTPVSTLFGYGGGALDFSLLNSNGEIYPSFYDSKYEIVGIYSYKGSTSQSFGDLDIGRDTIIIPSSSVDSGYSQNIADFGVARHETSSFQIPNGEIDYYKNLFSEYNVDDIFDIQYMDNGYELIVSSLVDSANFAIYLICLGFLVTVSVVAFIVYFFIIKDTKRIAIERALGMSKNSCRVSILFGIITASIIGIILGLVIANSLLKDMSFAQIEETVVYSTDYSSNKNDILDDTVSEQISIEYDMQTMSVISISVSLFVVLLLILISLIFIDRILKKDPWTTLHNVMVE